MIVCSCRAVSDRVLEDAHRAGLSREEIEAQTGAGTDCGCCRAALDDILSAAACACRGADACPGCPRRRAA